MTLAATDQPSAERQFSKYLQWFMLFAIYSLTQWTLIIEIFWSYHLKLIIIVSVSSISVNCRRINIFFVFIMQMYEMILLFHNYFEGKKRYFRETSNLLFSVFFHDVYLIFMIWVLLVCVFIFFPFWFCQSIQNKRNEE